MSIRIKQGDINSGGVVFQSGESGGALEENVNTVLRTLMEFYESDQVGDEVESEVDLMIQLSGMTYNFTQTDE